MSIQSVLTIVACSVLGACAAHFEEVEAYAYYDTYGVPSACVVHSPTAQIRFRCLPDDELTAGCPGSDLLTELWVTPEIAGHEYGEITQQLELTCR